MSDELKSEQEAREHLATTAKKHLNDALEPFKWKKGQSGNPNGRPPKSKAQSLVLVALLDISMQAANELKSCLKSEDETIRLSAAKFIISTLHKAGKLERELTESEERLLDSELLSLSDEELTARLKLKPSLTASEVTISDDKQGGGGTG